MTFAARTLGGLFTSGVQPLGTMAVRDVKPFISASASITFATDGAISYTGNQSTGPTAWFMPLTPAIGSGYWVRFTLSSGSAWDTGLTSGALNQLSSARTLVWSASAGISKTAVVAVQVYSDAGGTVLVASGTINVYSSGMN